MNVTTQRAPGAGVLHPLALLGIATLLLNDHVLKAAVPGVVTGKLSDFAGLLFFPLLLQAIIEWTAVSLRCWRGPSLRVLACCAIATGVCFAAIETWLPADALYREAWSAMQTLPRAVVAFVLERPTPQPVVVAHVMDVEDLIALPALALAVWTGRASRDRHGARAREPYFFFAPAAFAIEAAAAMPERAAPSECPLHSQSPTR